MVTSVTKMQPFHVKAAKVLPLVGPTLVIFALIICVSIAKVDNIYIGGLEWPYFSDTGRDAPAYYVFALLLTVVGVITAIVWHANLLFQRAYFRNNPGTYSPHIYRTCIAANAIGMISSVGLPILSLFDTSEYSDLHMYGAYWYTIWEAVATLMNVSGSVMLTLLARWSLTRWQYVDNCHTSHLQSNTNQRQY